VSEQRDQLQRDIGAERNEINTLRANIDAERSELNALRSNVHSALDAERNDIDVLQRNIDAERGDIDAQRSALRREKRDAAVSVAARTSASASPSTGASMMATSSRAVAASNSASASLSSASTSSRVVAALRALFVDADEYAALRRHIRRDPAFRRAIATLVGDINGVTLVGSASAHVTPFCGACERAHTHLTIFMQLRTLQQSLICGIDDNNVDDNIGGIGVNLSAPFVATGGAAQFDDDNYDGSEYDDDGSGLYGRHDTDAGDTADVRDDVRARRTYDARVYATDGVVEAAAAAIAIAAVGTGIEDDSGFDDESIDTDDLLGSDSSEVA
jgi:hypothetical protein